MRVGWRETPDFRPPCRMEAFDTAQGKKKSPEGLFEDWRKGRAAVNGNGHWAGGVLLPPAAWAARPNQRQ